MEGEEPEAPGGTKTPIRPRARPRNALEGLMVFPDRDRRLPSGKTPFGARGHAMPEDPSDAGAAPEADAAPPNAVKRPVAGRRQRRNRLPASYSPSAVFWICFLSAALSGAVFFALGRQSGKTGAEAEGRVAISVDSGFASEAQLAELESSLRDLQNGMFPEAKNALSNLLEEKAPISSLALLAANAALLDGDVPLAERYARLSIERGESVSDALVLQAVIEAKLATTPGHKTMGNPRIRIESLLQQAIAADASNPRPYFELATLRRFEKRHAEALELLQSASNRLGQSDSLMAVELAKELASLEQLPDAELAGAAPPGQDAQSLLCAAYAAARLGDPGKAAELFDQARSAVPARTFFQMMKDPAFTPWRKEPALEKFFPKAETK